MARRSASSESADPFTPFLSCIVDRCLVFEASPHFSYPFRCGLLRSVLASFHPGLTNGHEKSGLETKKSESRKTRAFFPGGGNQGMSNRFPAAVDQRPRRSSITRRRGAIPSRGRTRFSQGLVKGMEIGGDGIGTSASDRFSRTSAILHSECSRRLPFRNPAAGCGGFVPDGPRRRGRRAHSRVPEAALGHEAAPDIGHAKGAVARQVEERIGHGPPPGALAVEGTPRPAGKPDAVAVQEGDVLVRTSRQMASTSGDPSASPC